MASPMTSACPLGEGLRLTPRAFRPRGTIVRVGDVAFGGPDVVLVAGPCAVESEARLLETARAVKAAGAVVLRGGAFKPRTSPYSFRGLGDEGLALLERARADTGLPVVTEVLDARHLERVAARVDMLQIGSRSMQNVVLLEEAGRSGRPLLLKRGMSATLAEYLHAAERVLLAGNERVVLCERGIRSFEPSTRYTFDVNAIPMLKRCTHLPVIADPSHGTGCAWMVADVAAAAVAAGADGVMIEVHPDPPSALSDGAQALTPDAYAAAVRRLADVAAAVGRALARAASPDPAFRAAAS